MNPYLHKDDTYVELDKPLDSDVHAILEATEDTDHMETKKVFAFLTGMLHPNFAGSTEDIMRRGLFFNNNNALIYQMLRFLWAKFQVLSGKTPEEGSVDKALTEELETFVTTLQEEKDFPSFHHLEYVRNPYMLLDSKVQTARKDLGAGFQPPSSKKFFSFLKEHPALFVEYKRYRQLYEKKDFTQDEERYEAQQESVEKKPAAGQKRQRQE